MAAVYNVPPALAATQHMPVRVHPKSGMAEIRRTKQVVQIDDIRSMPPYLEGDPRLVALADLGGARTTLAVPMVEEGARSARSPSIARRCGRSPTSRSTGQEFRQAGRHRHREHPAAQRAARIAAAADRDRRRAQGDQPFDVRSAAGFRSHAGRIGSGSARPSMRHIAPTGRGDALPARREHGLPQWIHRGTTASIDRPGCPGSGSHAAATRLEAQAVHPGRA